MSAPSTNPNREVYLIQPKFPPTYWSMEKALKFTPFKAVYPPLGLLTLAATTPRDYQVTICDENAGDTVDYNTSAKLVGITGYIFQNKRVFEHADRFRSRGKTVILGGPIANLMQQECRPHCDVLFYGEAEYTWPKFLRDYAAGQWADHYVQEEKIHLPDSPPPRLDVIDKRYMHGIVQCSRGCPFTCEFCDIIVMYGRKMRFKPIAQVLREVKAWQRHGASQVFFADDNFVGHRAYVKDLLRALAEWNSKQRRPVSFYTQTSIDMVRDKELLGLLRDANFVAVFIGIESPRQESLAEIRKTQNQKVDLVEAIHEIQSYNLFIWAGMIVGLDHDDSSIFDEQYEFIQKAQIPVVMVNGLFAAPETPLHKRLSAEGRLFPFDAQRDDYSMYMGGRGTNFRPKRMTLEELQEGQSRLYQRLYAAEAFKARLLGNISRFHNVRYRPEPLRWDLVASFVQICKNYWRQGAESRRFFGRILYNTLRHSPRSFLQVATQLGMYEHFASVQATARSWDRWERQGTAKSSNSSQTLQRTRADSAHGSESATSLTRQLSRTVSAR